MESLTEDLYNAAEKLIEEVEEMGSFCSLQPAHTDGGRVCDGMLGWYCLMVAFAVIMIAVCLSGGMAAAIEGGMPKLMIEESAAKKQARIDSGQETVVGVNKCVSSTCWLAGEFVESASHLSTHAARDGRLVFFSPCRYLSDAEPVDVLAIDNAAVRAKQVARLKSVREARDETAAQEALSALRESARLTESTGSGEHPQNLLALVRCCRLSGGGCFFCCCCC